MYDNLSALNGQCKFSIGLVSPSPCHCILGSFLTFKYHFAQNIYAWTFTHDDISALKST